MKRILYSGTKNASSWAFRAWLALKEAGVCFEECVVDIRRPQRFANLAHVGEFSPPAAVPVLVEDNNIIFDSLAIMEYANELADGALLPENICKRAHARGLVAWQHSGLSGICPDLSFESAFYPKRRAMTQKEREESARIVRVWECELNGSGGPWLLGRLTLVDLAFVPTVIRLTSHGERFSDAPLSAKWSDALLSREHVAAWMTDAASLPPVIC